MGCSQQTLEGSAVACWELLQCRGALPTQPARDTALELELPGSSLGERELLFGVGFLKARVGGGCGREVGRTMIMWWNKDVTREAAGRCLGGISACAWCSPAL